MGCDGVLVLLTLVLSLFQFTQPKWAATTTRDDKERAKMVSIHAAQMGCDSRIREKIVSHRSFNSRSPNGLRPKTVGMVQTMHGFNSRSPNGLRLARRLDKTRNSLFQFTQPKWAATVCWRCQSQKLLRFNSRSPNGLRPNRLIVSPKNDVSIHAAQAGCGRGGATFGDFRPGFNSRSPSGLRLVGEHPRLFCYRVSIHAAQAGCDFECVCHVHALSVSIHAAQAGCDKQHLQIYD